MEERTLWIGGRLEWGENSVYWTGTSLILDAGISRKGLAPGERLEIVELYYPGAAFHCVFLDSQLDIFSDAIKTHQKRISIPNPIYWRFSAFFSFCLLSLPPLLKSSAAVLEGNATSGTFTERNWGPAAAWPLFQKKDIGLLFAVLFPIWKRSLGLGQQGPLWDTVELFHYWVYQANSSSKQIWWRAPEPCVWQTGADVKCRKIYRQLKRTPVVNSPVSRVPPPCGLFYGLKFHEDEILDVTFCTCDTAGSDKARTAGLNIQK